VTSLLTGLRMAILPAITHSEETQAGKPGDSSQELPRTLLYPPEATRVPGTIVEAPSGARSRLSPIDYR
jgi:hypothetical protein